MDGKIIPKKYQRKQGGGVHAILTMSKSKQIKLKGHCVFYNRVIYYFFSK